MKHYYVVSLDEKTGEKWDLAVLDFRTEAELICRIFSKNPLPGEKIFIEECSDHQIFI